MKSKRRRIKAEKGIIRSGKKTDKEDEEKKKKRR